MCATSRACGVDPSVAGTARAHAATAVAAGYGKDGWSRVVDVLRGTLR